MGTSVREKDGESSRQYALVGPCSTIQLIRTFLQWGWGGKRCVATDCTATGNQILWARHPTNPPSREVEDLACGRDGQGPVSHPVNIRQSQVLASVKPF